jgi:hypothetical protein
MSNKVNIKNTDYDFLSFLEQKTFHKMAITLDLVDFFKFFKISFSLSISNKCSSEKNYIIAPPKRTVYKRVKKRSRQKTKN